MQTLMTRGNNVVEVRDLSNSVDGLPVTNATVVCTVVDGAANPVLGETWPITLNHAGGGTYRATLRELQVSTGVWYSAEVTATTPEGHKHTWSVPMKAGGDVVY
jgi:hypothetical protein